REEGGGGEVGEDEDRGASQNRQPAKRSRERPRGRSGRPPRPHPCPETTGQGRHGRLRLERPARSAGQDPGGGGRNRARTGCRRSRNRRRRGGRSPICCRQPCPPSQCGPRSDAACYESEVRAPLCGDRTRACGSWQEAADGKPRGDGRVVERGQGCRTHTRSRRLTLSEPRGALSVPVLGVDLGGNI